VSYLPFVEKRGKHESISKRSMIFISNVKNWLTETFLFHKIIDKKMFILGCSETNMVNLVNYHLKKIYIGIKVRWIRLVVEKKSN
jgi:hypothetical protein